MTYLAQRFACGVRKFGREWSGTDTGAVGLEDTINTADMLRRYAEPCAGTGAERVRRSDKRIGTKIDIQQRALCALGEDGLVGLDKMVDNDLVIHNRELAQLLDGGQPCCIRRQLNTAEQFSVCLFERIVLVQKVGTQDVAHTQAVAGDLVGVGRADTFARGAYFLGTLLALLGCIQQAVSRQNQVGTLSNREPLAYIDAHSLDGVNLFHQNDRIDNYAVANDVLCPLTENTRRHGV